MSLRLRSLLCCVVSADGCEIVPDTQIFLWFSVNVDEEAVAVGGEFFKLIEEFLRPIFLYRMLLNVDVELGATPESNPAFESRGL